MYQPIIIFIGLRYILKKKITQLNQYIAYFSILTMTLGVMSLIIILSIINGFERKLEKKILYTTPHVLLISQTGNINSQKNQDSYLKKLKDIIRIDPIITSDVILQSSKNISLGTIFGINPKNFEPLSDFMIYGSITQLVPNRYHVILGMRLAEQLKVQIGDNIRIILPNIVKITPIGNIPTQRIFKIVGIYITNTNTDNYQLLINQEDGTRLLHYPPGYVTGWRLWLKDPLKINYFDKKKQLPNTIIKKDWRERQGNIFKAIQMEKNMIGILLSSIIFMSGFNIIAFSCLFITEKKKEIAILKTQGLNNKKMILLFTIQGTSIGIFGTIFGTFFGYFFTKKINSIISFFNFFKNEIILPIHIDIKQITIIAIITISISFLATLYSAKIIKTINPSEILRHE